MTQLIKYEAARAALAEAVMFDEVMSIMNVAQQAALYAKQANDNDLVEKATEIRVRAQRKAGEMLTRSKDDRHIPNKSDSGARGAAARHGKSVEPTSQVTLKEIGVTKEQSSQWQQLASMTSEHFEAAVATAKDTAGQVTTAFMLREAKAAKPSAPPKKGPKADAIRAELKEAAARGVSMLMTYAGLTLRALHSQDSVSVAEASLLRELADAIAAMTAEGSETK